MIAGNTGGHVYLGVGHGDVFQVNGGDPLTTRLDDIFAAVGDQQITVFVDGGHITGVEPAFGRRR
ncbi:hypothetical protein D3C76_1851920 [compost metagenome]